MTRRHWSILCGTFLLAAIVGAVAVRVGCQREGGTPTGGAEEPPSTSTASRIRRPAVAGTFYQRDPDALAKQVDELLAKAEVHDIPRLRGLICPHAGYVYSGPVAATAYKQLAGRGIETVILLGPSHTADFAGGSIPDVDAYETPLGLVPLSAKARQLATIRPFACNPPARVARPRGWQGASKELPPFGKETPHTWEHSLEVQLPFLQRTLKDFTIAPILLQRVDARAAAGVLVEHALDERTLVIASSDLSHYYAYAVAKRLDELCVRDIVNLNFEGMQRHEACGMRAILALMHMAVMKGWQAKLLDCRNSGDTSGAKDRVVGYAAIAFFESPRLPPVPRTFPAEPKRAYSDDERKRLVELARRTVVHVVTEGTLPAVDADDMPAKLREKRGCFVTLRRKADGQLRGCIGHIMPVEPLYKAVMDNARSAAVKDKRFPPVRPEELDRLEVEVSVLTVPQPLAHDSPLDVLTKLRPEIDGVVLRLDEHQATYLPQVWREMPNKVHFLCTLARKAGLPYAGWTDRRAAIWTYQAEAFTESQVEATSSH
jgi:hypothetical protein